MDPVLYHTHHSLRSEDIPFWRDLAIQSGGPVLELGCGTGRILLRHVKDNLQVTGLDNDPRMLQFLNRMVPPTLAHLVDVVEMDMRAFDLGRKFSLITLPCNTVSTFSSDDRRLVFKRARRHLDPNGVFAFSMPNPLLLADLPEIGEEELEDEFNHPATGHPVNVYSSWRRIEDQITFYWRYDHVYPDERVTHAEHSTVHYLDPPQTYIAELKACGLRPVTAYGDFYRSNFEPEASYFVVLSKVEK